LYRLRETIGEDEMEARRLRVGDAYTFQGDERDVVLVSMVVSANDGRLAAFTKREYHRRINVAASRARDQLWIYHSVQPQSLLADDARGLLLTYAQNVTDVAVAGDLALRCESDFERDVLGRLTDRGYRPIPQFRIGGYRIDFVLNAPDGRRLAIECDGDSYHGPEQWESDMRRQAVLERVGNCVFVRIRGSIFAREPEAAMRPLWQRIEELDITPWRPETVEVVDAGAAVGTAAIAEVAARSPDGVVEGEALSAAGVVGGEALSLAGVVESGALSVAGVVDSGAPTVPEVAPTVPEVGEAGVEPAAGVEEDGALPEGGAGELGAPSAAGVEAGGVPSAPDIEAGEASLEGGVRDVGSPPAADAGEGTIAGPAASGSAQHGGEADQPGE
jgi:very-short-patch-repair endonuclease